MDHANLPRHIIQGVERRWAQKLQQQACAWKGTRTETRSMTNTGVRVVRRAKRSRQLSERDATS